MEVFNEALALGNKIALKYDNLTNLYVHGEQESDKFYDLVEELDNLVSVERKLYLDLSDDQIKSYLDSMKEIDLRSVNHCNGFFRYFIGLKNMQEERTDKEYFITKRFAEALLLIDTFKLVKKTINDTEFDNDQEAKLSSYLNSLLDFNRIEMTMTAPVLEQMSLASCFELDATPALTFDDITYKANDKNRRLKIVTDLFMDLSFDAIDGIKDIGMNSKEDIYDCLFFCCELEVIMNKLDKNSINQIIKYYNNYKNDNGYTDHYAKQLFKKLKRD